MNCTRLALLLAAVALATAASGATLCVEQNKANASDENPGTVIKPFKTISKAAAMAQPGDTVIIGSGVYREHVSPARGGSGPDKMITYSARSGATVIIKGSDLWKPKWTPATLDGVTTHVWEARLDSSLFTYDFPIKAYNPFHQSPLRIYSTTIEEYYAPVRPAKPDAPLEETRGALFLDGKPLKQIMNATFFNLASGVFMVSPDGGSVLVRLPLDRSPQGVEFEIATREQVFAPREMDLNFIRLQGLTFEQAANGNGVPQFGMVSATRGKYWIIEDCNFRWAGTVGLDIGRGAWYDLPARKGGSSASSGKLDFDMIVRRCTFSDNGTAGLWCYSHARSILVEDSVFERNNWLGRLTWEEAGLKCHGIVNSVFRNNLFRDNDSFGIWLDVCGANNRITQNLFIGNMNAGVFIEAVAGASLVDNNISIFSRPFTFQQMTQADGFYNHMASNVIFAHNLSYGNTGFGFRCLLHSVQHTIPFENKPCKVSHNRILNNIAYANGRGAVGLPVDQRLCWGNSSAGNFFWGATDAPLFELQRGIMPPSELIAVVEKAIEKTNVPANEAPLLDLWKKGQLGPNVGDMRHNGPLVTLPVWQAAQGYDKDAVVGPLPVFRVHWDGRMLIHLKRPEKPYGKVAGDGDEAVGARPESYADIRDAKCERLPYIKYDYFGKLRPSDQPPTVGPIQNMADLAGGDAPVTLELWPNASPNRPPATEMRIDIEALPVIAEGETPS